MIRIARLARTLVLGSGFVMILGAQNDGRRAVGIVAEVRGTWIRASDGRVVRVRDEVFADTTFRTTKGATSGNIKVSFFDRRTVWNQPCTTQVPCDSGSYGFPVLPEPPRGFLAFLGTYASARPQVPGVFLAARTIGATGPREAVLSENDGTVSLTNSLTGIVPGRLRVTLSDPLAKRESGFSAMLNWPKEFQMTFRNQVPAILALDVEDENGNVIGAPAAVLVVGKELTANAVAQFNDAKSVTSGWIGVDEATIRGFLVQSLYAIRLNLR